MPIFQVHLAKKSNLISYQVRPLLKAHNFYDIKCTKITWNPSPTGYFLHQFAIQVIAELTKLHGTFAFQTGSK